ncbi:hypothetical protein EDB80DRAFT_243511 [Ilyonectria destructans]|nr:hypothetical protein EDB80DRAFT_243511 [Ilyonectria destructans]
MRSYRSHIALWAYVWTWASAIATATAADSRFILYLDQYHTIELPHTSDTKGINYVNVAFANSSLFASDPAGQYTPFKSVSDVRLLFDEGVKVCLAIGGWADTAGFSEGAKTPESRQAYAKNVADAIDGLGFDCVGRAGSLPYMPPLAIVLTTTRFGLGISRRQRRGLQEDSKQG